MSVAWVRMSQQAGNRRSERNSAKSDEQEARHGTHQLSPVLAAQLAWTAKPRDEKAVGAVMTGGQEAAGPIDTPPSNAGLLTNPR